MCSCGFDGIPLVEIDPEGVFKYILLRVHDHDKRGNEENFTIVRGFQRHDYHSDIYDEVQAKLKPLQCEPLGGGRIVHKPHKKKIQIYGFSMGYGEADHEITAKLLQEAFPDYTITILKEEDQVPEPEPEPEPQYVWEHTDQMDYFIDDPVAYVEESEPEKGYSQVPGEGYHEDPNTYYSEPPPPA